MKTTEFGELTEYGELKAKKIISSNEYASLFYLGSDRSGINPVIPFRAKWVETIIRREQEHEQESLKVLNCYDRENNRILQIMLNDESSLASHLS